MSEQSVKKRGNPSWVKGGASPNPKGRPRTGMALAEYFRRHTDVAELHALAMSIARGEGISLERDDRGRALPGPVSIPTARDRIAAMTFVRDTGFFKPATMIGVASVDPDDLDGGIDYDSLPPEQVDEVIAGLDRAMVAAGRPSILLVDDSGSDIIDVESSDG
jgi:hypothetical protein